MIDYKTEEEIEVQRKSSLLVGKTLAEVAKLIEPGVTTLMLDKVAEEFIRDNNAIPGFKDYNGFPNTLCTSVNDQVVHGIPSDKPLKEGDIVSVDCGVLYEGFYGDSAYTFAVGEISDEIKQLLEVTKKSLLMGLEKAIVGNRVGDIGYTIQQYTESFGYGVVRELVGHGVGKNLHESPEVPNYGRRKSGLKLKQGLVLAIEPMINLGIKEVKQLKDGWTIVTADGKPSAHFEHDVAVKRGKVDVLSTFEYIEEVLKK
jgi:methionyl aminopeptidase